jgi:hypothetical protein
MRRTQPYNARIVMSCLTASVKSDLHALLDEVVDPLLNQAVSNDPNLTARSAEQGCWAAVIQLGAMLLTSLLGLWCRTVAEEAARSRGWDLPGTDGDGPTARFRLDADYLAHFSSTFGRIVVPLFAMRSPGVGSATWTPARSLFPHYPNMRSTELLLEWECAVAADHPFRKAADALLFFSHGAVDIEDTTVERHAVQIGNRVPTSWLYRTPAGIRDILRNQATVDSETGRPIVYASTDAHALKRFVDEKWNPKWKMTNGIRVWAVDRHTGKTIHLGGEYTWGDCMEVRKRFQWLQTAGILPADGDYGDGVIAQVALLTDGLDWISGYVLSLFPDAVLALDPYHVLQHVSDAATKAYPAKKHKKKVRDLLAVARKALGVRKRRGRTVYRKGPNRVLQKTRRTGYDGAGQRLLDEVLRPLLAEAERGTHRIRQAIAYVERNLYRLNYGDLRKRGFQIGSGAMESLHRTGSQVRLKRAGCHWTAEASQGILNLRMLGLSGRWKEYWNQPVLPHLRPLGFAS